MWCRASSRVWENKHFSRDLKEGATKYQSSWCPWALRIGTSRRHLLNFKAGHPAFYHFCLWPRKALVPGFVCLGLWLGLFGFFYWLPRILKKILKISWIGEYTEKSNPGAKYHHEKCDSGFSSRLGQEEKYSFLFYCNISFLSGCRTLWQRHANCLLDRNAGTVSPGVLGTVNFLGIFVFVVSQSLVLCGEMGEKEWLPKVFNI